ncbi:hypothetical protein B0H16DRAFT_1638430 [Mycena metata]|uniref:Uncharacterized protein n=1 Tax=Mycena metata TaxID=1033252 RepID=A0AAD7M6J6_9AGAR|nr:hypothetical protein B0H16DRAFT_1638430 [Mycena metata]
MPHVSIYLAVLASLPIVLGSVNFDTCLAQVRHGDFGLTGGTDNQGRPVSNISLATAITYNLCVVACGSGPEPFLLPYLALVSQLPFGANNKLDNLLSMLLTVGSPTLAAYSLALTVLNEHWIAQRFSALSYPNVRNAVKVLIGLQQSPLHVNVDDPLLASLVVLHANDNYWETLEDLLNYVQTWSISAVASILWVIIAYIFTVIDSFLGVVTYSTLNSNGQAVGSIFLWLLPIVVGWLQISPKCDHERVHQAVERANKIAYVASPSGEPRLASELSTKRAIYLSKGTGDVHRDEHCTAPIYNYARFLPWSLSVENVYYAFREASERSQSYEPVDSGLEWEKGVKGDRNMRVHPRNRTGSLSQVSDYVKIKAAEFEMNLRPRSRWGPGVVSRFLLAALLALSLTWGTTGAAVLVAFFTPTKGIGCRSGSYLIYGVNSTLVWMLLVASSLLAHYSTFTVSFKGRYMHTKTTRLAGVLSIILRRLGKVLASLNSVWLILACLFQFGSVFDRCWCNSSVPYYVEALNAPWIGGVALASGCAILFIGFVNVLINPALPD